MVSRAAKKTGRKPTKKAATRSHVPMGPRRAASFVYAVINPLIDVLKGEVDSLAKGHLSWRALEQRLEFIRPPRLYLMPDGRTILEDFEQVFPKEARPLRQHDEHVKELTRRAEAAHGALLERPEFRTRVLQLMEDHRRKEGRDAWLGWSEEQVMDRLAEYIINRSEDLERTGEFFRNAVPLLQEFRSGKEFSRLDEVAEACREDAIRLIEHLRSVRFRLCNEYDIPAAPVASVAHFEEA